MEALLIKAGLVWGLVLTVVRAVEAIYQLSKTPEAKTLKEKIIQILKNFFFDLETYKNR